MTQEQSETAINCDAAAPSGLLVDDRRGQLVTCQKLLRSLGAEVDTATTVAAAENLVKSRHYQFALIDFLIGRSSSGTKGLVQLLKRQSPLCKVYIVTAYPTDASDALSGLKLPIVGKPVSVETLKTIVSRPSS